MLVIFIHFNFESLSIECLSASLKKTGYSTSLIFRVVGRKELEGKSSKSFLTSLAKEAIGQNPRLIAFSVLSDYYSFTAQVAKEIRSLNKNIPIIFGGIHPTSSPETVIEEDFVDYVCVGEGEEAFVELADALKNGKDTTQIKNIWTKKNGITIKNPPRDLTKNLDSYPFPDKKLFYQYCNAMVKDYSTFSSRGCLYHCSYCYNSILKNVYLHSGKYFRKRSVDNLIAELVFAKKNYKIRSIFFIDDIFCADKDFLDEFAIKYEEFVTLPYFCLAFPNANIINEYNLKLLRESGCIHISLGIQCLNQHIRNDILKRPGSNDDILNSVKLLKDSKIFTNVELMVGLPKQTPDDIIRLIRFFSENRPDTITVYWLRYYPGTEIMNYCETDFTINEQSFSPFTEGGSTYSKNTAKLVDLLLLSNILPKQIIDWSLKKKIYRYLPGQNLLFMHFNTLFGLLRKGLLLSRLFYVLMLKNSLDHIKLRLNVKP